MIQMSYIEQFNDMPYMTMQSFDVTYDYGHKYDWW